MKTIDSKVGTIKLTGLGDCDIIIKGSSEKYRTPHFHLVSKDNNFETTICIYDNRYFSKEAKDKLNDQQSKELEDAVKEVNDPEYDGDIIMAAGMRLLWIGKHGERYCKDLYPIPRYSKINYTKEK